MKDAAGNICYCFKSHLHGYHHHAYGVETFTPAGITQIDSETNQEDLTIRQGSGHIHGHRLRSMWLGQAICMDTGYGVCGWVRPYAWTQLNNNTSKHLAYMYAGNLAAAMKVLLTCNFVHFFSNLNVQNFNLISAKCINV